MKKLHFWLYKSFKKVGNLKKGEERSNVETSIRGASAILGVKRVSINVHYITNWFHDSFLHIHIHV